MDHHIEALAQLPAETQGYLLSLQALVTALLASHPDRGAVLDLAKANIIANKANALALASSSSVRVRSHVAALFTAAGETMDSVERSLQL